MQKEYKINQVNPSKGALEFSYLLDICIMRTGQEQDFLDSIWQPGPMR